ncbi:hypothetical protein ACH4VR_36330 [Streptomyces sp. NPDC020883]|uniref:hypothetical protein n=1 Tax=Streptomyces sp. NPDC020883 TaxID=3365099 RepID=UPI0037B4C68A
MERAVRAELHRLRSVLGEQADVERVLRRRLALRMQEQGAVPVKDPVGWFIGRGLPQRQHCPERRCDDGRLMHNGTDCEACRWLVWDKRALRTSVAQRLAESLGLPDATALLAHDVPIDLRTRLESTLRQECRELAQKHAAAMQEHALYEEQLREAGERRRQEEAAWAQEQQLLPCEVCGQARSGGLCPGCRATRQTEERIREAVGLALAVFGDQPQSPAKADLAVASAAEAGMRRRVEGSIAACRAEGGFASVAAQRGLLEAELELDRLRSSSLEYLASTREARLAGRQAFEAEMRRAPMYESYQAAQQGALEAEGQAQQRVAEHLLKERLRSFRAERQRQDTAPPDLYAIRASEVRALLCSPRPSPDKAAADSAGGTRRDGQGRRTELVRQPLGKATVATAHATAGSV